MTKEEVFENNKLLAYKIIQKYKTSGIEYEDLEQIAMLALWKAAITYKQEKGFTFSTYAYRVIQNEINSYLRKNRKYFTDRHLEEKIYEGTTLEEVITDNKNNIEEFEERVDCQNLINQIKNNLSKNKEKQVFKLAQKGYKQVQIGLKIGISQAQVSRILKKIRAGVVYEI